MTGSKMWAVSAAALLTFGASSPAMAQPAQSDAVVIMTDPTVETLMRHWQLGPAVPPPGSRGLPRLDTSVPPVSGTPQAASAPPVPRPVAHSITFGYGSTQLSQASMRFASMLGEVLKFAPTLKFSISGHADRSGDERINEVLALSRADAVRKYIVDMGISAGRITIEGMGSRRPLSGFDPYDANNRRVEVTPSAQ